MSTDVAVVAAQAEEGPGWRLVGKANIDDRPATNCILIIRPDGTWGAEVAAFTLAGEVELFFISTAGGHFCGPAGVASSRADTEPWHLYTQLIGTGPLLVVAPTTVPLELPDAEMVDGEVVSEVAA